MSVAEQANLVVAISLRDQFSPSVRKLQTNLKTLDMQTAQLQRGLGKVGQGLAKGLQRSAVLAAGAVGLLATQVKSGITELIEWEDATLQVEAAIKSTNGVAKVNVALTQELAEKYAALSLAEDDVILASQSLLLRFPRITKDAFEPALAAALDLSQAMGTDLPSATRVVARALNDPIRGLSRLERAGVSFTEQEKKKIQRLQESGRTLEAQRLILQKLNRVYGGSAERATIGYRGKVKLLTDRIKDLQQALASPLLEPLTRVTEELTKFASSEEVKQGITDLGEGIASLFTAENIQTGIDSIKDGFGFLRDLPWNSIKDGLQTTADIAKRAVDLFKSLPPEVQGGLVTLLAANKLTGGLVASGLGDIAGFLLRNLTTINAAVVNVVGRSVNAPGGGVPGGGTPGSGTPGGGGAGRTGPRTSIPQGPPAPRTPIGRRLTTPIGQGPGSAGPLGILLGLALGGGLDNVVREDDPVYKALVERSRRLGQNVPGGSEGGPGRGRVGLDTVNANIVRQTEAFWTTFDKSVTEGKLDRAKLQEIARKVAEGKITVAQGNNRLQKLEERTIEQTTAIENQKTEVNLSPQINISAAQTGSAITLAATGSRIVIR